MSLPPDIVADPFTAGLADLFAEGPVAAGLITVDEVEAQWADTLADIELGEAVKSLRKAAGRIWRQFARPEQLPPAGDWDYWLLMAGRGFGKSWVGSNVLADWALERKGDYAIVAPTFPDARKICTESEESGVLAALGGEHGPNVESYNRSDYIIRLTNGSRIVLASADAPDRIRGWNLSGVWVDEVASFRDTTVWYEGLEFATRLGDPRFVVTTTPRRGHPILVDLMGQYRTAGGDPLGRGGLAGPVHLTRGATMDNAANLADRFLDKLRRQYEGTTLGRQELEGELLPDVEGALVRTGLIDATRVQGHQVPELWEVAVGVDPSVSTRKATNRTGIIAAGLGPAPHDWVPPAGLSPEVIAALDGAGHIYLLEDATTAPHVAPPLWAQSVLVLCDEWDADRVVAEVNQGGELVTALLRTAATTSGIVLPRLDAVHASRGKLTRAEPMAALWEQGRCHIVGKMTNVEERFATWVPGEDDDSPDELDATVWAAVGLMPELGVRARERIAVIAGG